MIYPILNIDQFEHSAEVSMELIDTEYDSELLCCLQASPDDFLILLQAFINQYNLGYNDGYIDALEDELDDMG